MSSPGQIFARAQDFRAALSQSNTRPVYNALGLAPDEPSAHVSDAYDPLEAGDGGSSSTDVLPDYAPPQHSQPIRYLHSMKSSKLELVIESVGAKLYPAFVQSVFPIIRGKVRLRGYDSNMTELRIRAKGVILTGILRSGQAGQARSVEEREFWYEGITLWSSSKGPLDASENPVEFPFSIRIPSQVASSTECGKGFPMPPSFVLQSVGAFDIGSIDTASVRYFVKVTLARKGLLRQNERILAPVVYLTRESNLSFLSAPRRQALTHGTVLPGPSQLPEAWEGLAEAKNYRKGWLNAKRADYKITLLLPTPLIYGKIESLPYYLRVTSNDAATLSNIGAASIEVALLQRCVATAQGSPGSHEVIVDKGVTEVAVDSAADFGENVRRFKGRLSLKDAPGVTFIAINLEVSYYIICRLRSVGGNLHDAFTSVPIKIVSIPPVASSAYGEHRPPMLGSDVQRMLTLAMPDLPPSYFEAGEPEDARRSQGLTPQKN